MLAHNVAQAGMSFERSHQVASTPAIPIKGAAGDGWRRRETAEQAKVQTRWIIGHGPERR